MQVVEIGTGPGVAETWQHCFSADDFGSLQRLGFTNIEFILVVIVPSHDDACLGIGLTHMLADRKQIASIETHAHGQTGCFVKRSRCAVALGDQQGWCTGARLHVTRMVGLPQPEVTLLDSAIGHEALLTIRADELQTAEFTAGLVDGNDQRCIDNVKAQPVRLNELGLQIRVLVIGGR